jgi:hypothetical protein
VFSVGCSPPPRAADRPGSGSPARPPGSLPPEPRTPPQYRPRPPPPPPASLSAVSALYVLICCHCSLSCSRSDCALLLPPPNTTRNPPHLPHPQRPCTREPHSHPPRAAPSAPPRHPTLPAAPTTPPLPSKAPAPPRPRRNTPCTDVSRSGDHQRQGGAPPSPSTAGEILHLADEAGVLPLLLAHAEGPAPSPIRVREAPAGPALPTFGTPSAGASSSNDRGLVDLTQDGEVSGLGRTAKTCPAP